MPNSIGKYFKKLSLTQQVLMIILLMLIFLALFFTFFMNKNIEVTISNQMYSVMDSRQKPIISALEANEPVDFENQLFQYLSTDSIQTNCLIEGDQIKFLTIPAHEFKTMEFYDFLITHARALVASTSQNESYGTIRVDDGTYYYLMEKCVSNGEKVVVASFMDDTYASEFRSSLIDSTVYVTVVAFSLILMILMLWAFSIIHPLNQIRLYISQIKQGKDVELNINREDEIGDVAHELISMKEELTKQEKSKEEMIHNISHDLKTPIATIKSYSESIKDGIYPYGDLESSVDVILDNAQRLEDKVHNLLYLNRVEYLITSDCEGVVTNMKEVVEQVVLNSAVIDPDIRLETDVEEVFFDGLIEAWRVAIENIMENAFRYAKSYIKIVVRENDLRIYNDGPKMPEDRIDTLFKPYEKGEGGRFGLGLSIVSKVTKANNYQVKGYNTEDGVCFRIYRDKPHKRTIKRGRKG
ncbi:HAMP domain-containing sensor histidine kinase [uncultured Dubosiella sp.]|uniref:HAMP domain-containing sensor histidine kinase n=1 Tax=uncultured Dubosiella sp. TaxID=1937011 RepID=UPI00259B42E0|nr:HAMP domain-containing sensor histidine kinase [uncultured Dubosiella sp.]